MPILSTNTRDFNLDRYTCIDYCEKITRCDWPFNHILTTYNVLLRYLAFVSRCYSLLSFYNELLIRWNQK